MYCVEWNTLKASPFRKSRAVSNPITGRKVNPVESGKLLCASIRFRKREISSSCGILSSVYPHILSSSGKT